MTKTQFLAIVGFAPLAFSTVAVAKRLAPKPVAPVVGNGICYSAQAQDGGTEQYVVATDSSTGKELWKAKVFQTHINPFLEKDVQVVFITDLKLIDNPLFVRDEKARCYSVDLKTREVHHAACRPAF